MKLENLIRIENGEKVKHTFWDAQYASRRGKLRAMMCNENIDGGQLWRRTVGDYNVV
jgi:creatinase